MRRFIFFLIAVLTLSGCAGHRAVEQKISNDLILKAQYEGANLYQAGPVSVLQLRGSYLQMGRQYGMLLKDELNSMHDVLVSHFVPHFTYDRLKQIAEAIYAVYPQNYKDIIIGMAETSQLGLEKQILVNALEFFPKVDSFVSHCSGIAVWGEYTGGGPLLFGRNNDDLELYKAFGKHMVVAVFNPPEPAIPTAIINYAGAVYAPNGINKHGLFLIMNAGNWQGYFIDRPSIFLSIFSMLQTCSTQAKLNEAFKPVVANISSIINAADGNMAYSFECSTKGGVVRRAPEANGLLVATNHFIDPSWGLLPIDPNEVSSVRRRNNLLSLAKANKGAIDAEKMKKIMDTSINEGGATHAGTIYQIIAVPRDLTLWIKAPNNFEWQKVDLRGLL